MGPLQTESGSCDSQMSRCAGQGALEAASEMGVSVLVINGRSSLKRQWCGRLGQVGEA